MLAHCTPVEAKKRKIMDMIKEQKSSGVARIKNFECSQELARGCGQKLTIDPPPPPPVPHAKLGLVVGGGGSGLAYKPSSNRYSRI